MPNHSALHDAISGMLIESDIFNHLPAEDIKAVARYFSVSDFNRGKIIFREGDIGTYMCILHKGDVSVIKTNQAGQEVEMAKLHRGRAFGEMAVLDGERRSATCKAATDCILLTLSREGMNNMLDETPQTGAQILRAIAVSLSRRLRIADGQLVDHIL